MLHSSIYIPILILFSSDNSLANISGTYKPMHATENKRTHRIPVVEPGDWLFLEVTLAMRGATFALVIFYRAFPLFLFH